MRQHSSSGNNDKRRPEPQATCICTRPTAATATTATTATTTATAKQSQRDSVTVLYGEFSQQPCWSGPKGTLSGAMGWTKYLMRLVCSVAAYTVDAPTHTYVETFAGQRAIDKGMKLHGYKGKAVDSTYGPEHDFMKPLGFFLTLIAVLGIHVGGVFWGAPVCSSWVYMSRSSTGRRSDNVLGDEDNRKVAYANAMVSRLCFLLVLCIKRGVWWIIEQPLTSLMFEHPLFRRLLTRWGHLIHIVYVEVENKEQIKKRKTITNKNT